MENFYKELQQQKELLITNIKKVCNELGNLDDIDIYIDALDKEIQIYCIDITEDNNLLLITDMYNCNVECLDYEQLYSLYIQLKELL